MADADAPVFGCATTDVYVAVTAEGPKYACYAHVALLEASIGLELIEFSNYRSHETGFFSRVARSCFASWHKCCICGVPCGSFDSLCPCAVAAAYRVAVRFPSAIEE